MRDIKFKIWADNKFYDKCLVGNTTNVNDDKWTCPMVWLEDKRKWVHCDNGIICEFTGLHDKNGKEIYEGDRVYIVPEDEYGEVKWDNETARFVVIYNDIWTDFDNWYGYDLEVVGTIYD